MQPLDDFFEECEGLPPIYPCTTPPKDLVLPPKLAELYDSWLLDPPDIDQEIYFYEEVESD